MMKTIRLDDNNIFIRIADYFRLLNWPRLVPIIIAFSILIIAIALMIIAIKFPTVTKSEPIDTWWIR